MSEEKNAYKILGLKEGASKDEIVKRYNVLYKKFVQKKNEDTPQEEEGVGFDEINRAYNELMGYPEADTDDKEPNALLKKMNIDQKKWGNFFHYHKLHILVGIVSLIFVVYIISVVTGYVKPDIEIAAAGNFQHNGLESFKSQIYSSMKDLEKVSVSEAILWNTKDPQVQSGMEVKMAHFALQAKIDIFLLDRERFNSLAARGVLISMESILGDSGREDIKKKECRYKSMNDQTEHIYGYDITGSSYVKDVNIPGEQVIVAMGNKGNNTEKAIRLLRLLLGIQ
jgi:hypothetical protein